MYSMWTRGSLKTRAKEILKLNYWKAFVVSLVIALTGGGSGGNGGNGSDTVIDLVDEFTDVNGFGVQSIENIETVVGWGTIIIVISVILLVVRLLVGYSLEIGGRKFFIRASEGESDMEYLSYGFKERRYGNILATMFTRAVYTFLWTLLFIIPGIIKSYSYRMVPYILADNPKIGRKRAIELSSEMTRDEKMNIFVLDLSFLGWYILGTLALFVGVLFVLPYENATNAELYLVFRENAIKKGLTTKAELNIQDDYI